MAEEPNNIINIPGLNQETRKTKFRNKNGRLLTRSLFYEMTVSGNSDHVMYTLRDHPWQGYPSLHTFYMDIDDLTEYKFALTCFESWNHWKEIIGLNWFKSVIQRWREELELQNTSQILTAIKIEAAKGSYQANKILLDYAEKLTSYPLNSSRPKVKRGRPSKLEVANELQERADEEAQLEEDLGRLLGEK